MKKGYESDKEDPIPIVDLVGNDVFEDFFEVYARILQQRDFTSVDDGFAIQASEKSSTQILSSSCDTQ